MVGSLNNHNVWEQIRRRRMKMIVTWLFLLLLFSLSEQDGQQTGVSRCGPQNLTVWGLGQTLLAEWEDDASCLALNDPITYNMTVLIENKEVYSDKVSVMPDDIGSTHSWNWTSYLPLECASHTFRLRSLVQNQMSQLEQEKTLPGQTGSGGERVFPQDAVFDVGSTATFCCVVPDGEKFDKMFLDGPTGRNMSTTKISEQRYALTLQLGASLLTGPRDPGVNVKCKTKQPSKGLYGSSFRVGYPPDVRDLWCETRDLESVECLWREGRGTMVELLSPTKYQLDGSKCDSKNKARCSKKLKVEVGEKNWTLTAWNRLGKVEIQDTADLTKRVHMLAPHELTVADVNARTAKLSWRWTVKRYDNLSLTCQTNITDTEGHIEHGVGLKVAILTDLRPNWEYQVKVRCRAAEHFWKWGTWSKTVTLRTLGDVPDPLDVWMEEKGNQTLIVWKRPLDHQSHGEIMQYQVTWARTSDSNRLNKTNVPPSAHRHALRLDTGEQYVIKVMAKNKNGSSSPSAITLPVISPDKTSMKVSRLIGSEGGFNLSWSGRPEASCGYIVDWVPANRTEPVDWRKLPPSQTSVRIESKNFKDGLRYQLSIYACTQTSALLLERMEGYVTETRIKDNLFTSLKYKQQGSHVEISWDPVSLREQSAFIHGYVLYWWETSGQNFSVTTNNPEDTSLTAKNLQTGSYTFKVAARTDVGECGNTTLIATLNFQSDSFIMIFIFSLCAVSALLLIITILCYHHWTCIKQKLYPEIPKPEMPDWFASPVKRVPPYLQTDLSHNAEEHTDIPQLHYKSGEPLNNNTQDSTGLISPQTPHSYQNQPAEKYWASPALNSSGPNVPSQSLFANPTYNPMMTGEDCTPSSDPKLQMRNGYQPQSLDEFFRLCQMDQDPVSFVSGYIMPPQPS
ncbi:leukemia inhibitory factor receptor isoform X2 [Fundulus heteroclitus]|uniref:leukemia inhibitory factor receptor isoform X2 n=1 Tax=Fundulus heteroclitus TaxID=8078 RepID=UPI00165AD990|nr:leukemia inhibitory factor receptor isoform X2 [Fundulus heteroclitus]